MSAPYRILFCTDFSDNADAAFDHAVVAASHHAMPLLYLLHVLPEPDAQFWKGYIYSADEDPDARARAAIDARIDANYRPRIPANLTFETHFRVGNPADQIVACATELPANLIVMGRQGRGALRSLFFGDVAARVVRHAPCPVLIIPLVK